MAALCFLAGDAGGACLGREWDGTSEGSHLTEAAAAAAAAASSLLRLNNPGDSAGATGGDCVASDAKNLDGAEVCVIGIAGTCFNSAGEDVVGVAAAVPLGFVKKLRISMRKSGV